MGAMDTNRESKPPTCKDPVGHVFAVPLGEGQWGLALVAFSRPRLARCNDLRVFYFDHILDSMPSTLPDVPLAYRRVVHIATATDEAIRRGACDPSMRWIDLGL